MTVTGAVTVLALAGGCASSASQPVAASAAATAAGAAGANKSAQNGGCPVPTTLTALPRDVPSDVPIPAGGTVLSDSVTADGLRVVRFAIPMSLRQGVLFILDRYPKAGFRLAHGDAEATEADAPFANQSGTLHGALRLSMVQPCSTTWVLAFTHTAAGHTIPKHTPSTGAATLSSS